MQRALCNMLMTENGTEKPDNELTTTLLENITTLAHLHQYKRAEEKQQKNYTLHHRVPTMIEYRSHAYRSPVQKKRHITQ